MTLDRTNCLALLAVLGIAMPGEIEELMERTLAKTRVVARTALDRRTIREADFDDVAQDAALRAWRCVPKWDSGRAGWLTYVGVIADTTVKEYRRKYAREPEKVPLEDCHDYI